jgi:hypothetical protein
LAPRGHICFGGGGGVTRVVRGNGGFVEFCHWPWFARVAGFAIWSYI